MRVLFALLVGAALTADAVQVNPIRKVLNMLDDMVAGLEKEAKADGEIYKKMSCWCSTVGAQKAQAIKDGKANIATQEMISEENNGRADTLSGQIAELTQNLKELAEFMERATKQRSEENNAYEATKASFEETISRLEGALKAINANEGLVQIKESLVSYAAIAKPHQIAKATALVQAPTSGAEGYHKQGGVVTGILEDMLETFNKNLSDANDKESDALEAYNKIMNIKTKMEASDNQARDAKRAEKGECVETAAKADQEKDLAEDQLIADIKFHQNLKDKCEETDKQMEQRETTRAQEMEGVNKAREILNGDDVQDLMRASQKTPLSFIQRKLTAADVRKEASAVLKKAAGTNVRLSLMATQVKLDALASVHKAIQKMIDDLKVQQQEERDHKQWCQKEMNQNKSDLQDGKNLLEENQIKLEREEVALRENKQKMQEALDEIEQTTKDVKLASEMRNKESEEYIAVYQNQSDVIMVLERVEEALAGAYGSAEEAGVNETNTSTEDNQGLALVQQPPPGGFRAYEKQGSSGVLAMISRIKADAAKERDEAHSTEVTNSNEYYGFLNDSNQAIRDRQALVAVTKQTIASLEKDRAESESGIDSATSTVTEEQTQGQELGLACDFTLKNFNVAQAARANEMEALGKAKAILSGSGGVQRF